MSAVPAPRRLRLGTRGSGLALAQTEAVASLLRALSPTLELDRCVVRTGGDADRQTPLPEIGGAGVFTAELERALVRGEIDIAVHSLKDLPLTSAAGVVTAALCARTDPRDVLVTRDGTTLETLRPGSVVGTSSARRTAQLLAARPDLLVGSIRGNVDTRIEKVMAGDYDAAILAAAGIIRLGLEDRISEFLSLDAFVPAAGQAALAVQCRSDDYEVRTLVAGLDDADVRACTGAERAFLAGLGGGCSLPVGAIARVADAGLDMDGWIGSVDGARSIRVHGQCGRDVEAANELGRTLALDALSAGAGELLA